jgi:isoleucyl-tRNA synthetase
MQVLPAHPPPPIRKQMCLRSTVKGGEVRVPVEPSPSEKRVHNPLRQSRDLHLARQRALGGPIPNAVPSVVHSP